MCRFEISNLLCYGLSQFVQIREGQHSAELNEAAAEPPASSSAGEEAMPTLTPLGSGRSAGNKKAVHRQLPEWIVNFHPVENAIQAYSQ